MERAVIDFNGRVRDRVRERRRRIRLAAKILLGLMVVAGLAWVGVASPLFSVKKVVVSGNAIVSTDDVTKAPRSRWASRWPRWTPPRSRDAS